MTIFTVDKKESLKHMKKITLYILISLTSISFLKAQYAWTPVGDGTNLAVNVLKADTINNILYAGGLFSQAGGISGSNIAKWDGANWSPLGFGVVSGTAISSMLVQGSDLIVGGTFTDIGGVIAKNVARWNGTVWLPLGAGLEYTGATTVSTLCEYAGELYAGGTFVLSGATPVNFIAKYDGVNWSPVGTGTNGRVLSLCVYGTELYVGGEFTNAGGISVNNIAKWNGSSWSDVGGGVQYTGATTVSTMSIFGSDLYVGGTFDQAGTTPVMNIAKWNGSVWGDVGGGVQYTGATTVSTLSMTVFENELIVGGVLDVSGSVSTSFISKWNGTVWSALGTGMNNAVQTVEVMADTLYAGGWFTSAGSEITLFVAQWSQSPTHVASIGGVGTKDAFFSVYPNPVDDQIKMVLVQEYAMTNDMSFEFILTDLTGREVMKQENIGTELLFNRESIPPGLYLYKIISKDRSMLQQGKLSFR